MLTNSNSQLYLYKETQLYLSVTVLGPSFDLPGYGDTSGLYPCFSL